MMNISFSPPDITEEEIAEVADALRSGWITTGPRTKEFEKRIAGYCGTGKAVCLNSATACLEMTLRVMGIGPGDEVITTAYTYSASASCICHVGAVPVLVDTLPGSFEMDPQKVSEAVTEKTKAVIVWIWRGSYTAIMMKFFRLLGKRAVFSDLQMSARRLSGGFWSSQMQPTPWAQRQGKRGAAQSQTLPVFPSMR